MLLSVLLSILVPMLLKLLERLLLSKNPFTIKEAAFLTKLVETVRKVEYTMAVRGLLVPK